MSFEFAGLVPTTLERECSAEVPNKRRTDDVPETSLNCENMEHRLSNIGDAINDSARFSNAGEDIRIRILTVCIENKLYTENNNLLV